MMLCFVGGSQAQHQSMVMKYLWISCSKELNRMQNNHPSAKKHILPLNFITTIDTKTHWYKMRQTFLNNFYLTFFKRSIWNVQPAKLQTET